MPQHKFKVKLIGEPGKSTAALKPPFDVVEVFHTKARVPVKGTINAFPFRSSLMNMGAGHMMAVNAQLRAGANCKAGDTVSVVMELDQDERKVEVPAPLKKIIASDPKAKESGQSSPSLIKKSGCAPSKTRKDRRPARNASRR